MAQPDTSPACTSNCAAGRDADTAVGGIPRCSPRRAHLGLHPILRALQTLRQDAQALPAPAAPRQQEAVHGLRGAHPGTGRRRPRPSVCVGPGGVQLYLRLRDGGPVDALVAGRHRPCAALHRRRAPNDRARQRPGGDRRADRYELRANDTALDFARHHDVSILPARPYALRTRPRWNRPCSWSSAGSWRGCATSGWPTCGPPT